MPDESESKIIESYCRHKIKREITQGKKHIDINFTFKKFRNIITYLNFVSNIYVRT